MRAGGGAGVKSPWALQPLTAAPSRVNFREIAEGGYDKLPGTQKPHGFSVSRLFWYFSSASKSMQIRA